MSWGLEFESGTTLDNGIFLLTPVLALFWDERAFGIGLSWLALRIEILLSWEPKD